MQDLGSRLPRSQAQKAIAFWERNLTHPFYVYVIQEVHGGPVKIGKARDPWQRRIELQCGNPRTLALRAVILARPASETRLHRAHSFCRLGGEWFGRGYEEAIVSAAQHAGKQQIEWYAEGKPVEYVIDHALTLITAPAPSADFDLEVAA